MKHENQKMTWGVTILTIMVAGALVLGACGDSNDSSGSSSSSSTQSGVFSDEPVVGISFTSGSQSGETDANGTFTYDSSAAKVSFSIGDIMIGDGNVSPFMTPVDLVNDDDPTAVDESNDRVTNIASFLQTIDDDGDPSNNILITQAVRDAAIGLSVNFDQTPADFANDPNVQSVIATLTAVTSAGPRTLVSAADAQAHLRGALLAELSGDYMGTFEGTSVAGPAVSGSWALAVDSAGAVTGTFTDDSGTVLPVSIPLDGTMPSSGDFTLSATYSPYTLMMDGMLSFSGDVSGSWNVTQSSAPVANGTFTSATGDNSGGGGDGIAETCTAFGRSGHFVHFHLTDENTSNTTDVKTCASFCGQVDAGNCSLQVFDTGYTPVAGDQDPPQRYFQFLTVTGFTNVLNTNLCLGFDASIDDGNGVRYSLNGAPTGRNFGADTQPFATGFYSGSDGSSGTFTFYEYYSPDNGFEGVNLPSQACN